ncbi:MAG: rRNA maturation RNAse YbeY [Patescibacteria group bacterium]
MIEKKFEIIKDHIFGKKYAISLVFAGNNLMKKLNRIYRKEPKPADVLAFPLSKSEGEIFINKIKKNKAVYLFIHALLHLKGYKHGKKMDGMEKKLTKKFNHAPHNKWN